jgi:uncharacterized membrane protein
MMLAVLFCIHLFATLFMVGLIWMVQLVHYPLFAQVGNAKFREYEVQHCRRISWIVVPVMVVEAMTSLPLLMSGTYSFVSPTVAWTGFGMLAAIWLVTALLSVPCHHLLSQEFSPQAHRKLVLTNWIRTSLWSVRGVMLTATLVQSLS